MYCTSWNRGIFALQLDQTNDVTTPTVLLLLQWFWNRSITASVIHQFNWQRASIDLLNIPCLDPLANLQLLFHPNVNQRSNLPLQSLSLSTVIRSTRILSRRNEIPTFIKRSLYRRLTSRCYRSLHHALSLNRWTTQTSSHGCCAMKRVYLHPCPHFFVGKQRDCSKAGICRDLSAG